MQKNKKLPPPAAFQNLYYSVNNPPLIPPGFQNPIGQGGVSAPPYLHVATPYNQGTMPAAAMMQPQPMPCYQQAQPPNSIKAGFFSPSSSFLLTINEKKKK